MGFFLSLNVYRVNISRVFKPWLEIFSYTCVQYDDCTGIDDTSLEYKSYTTSGVLFLPVFHTPCLEVQYFHIFFCARNSPFLPCTRAATFLARRSCPGERATTTGHGYRRMNAGRRLQHGECALRVGPPSLPSHPVDICDSSSVHTVRRRYRSGAVLPSMRPKHVAVQNRPRKREKVFQHTGSRSFQTLYKFYAGAY